MTPATPFRSRTSSSPSRLARLKVYRVVVPKQGGNEEVESITPIYPAAYIAENEAAEMFGIHVKGVPGRFFLPDSITAPLRRKSP